MVKNDVSFILSFVILMEKVVFRVLPWGVLDGTVWFIVLTCVLSV